MEFLKKFNLTGMQLIKFGGLVLGALVVLFVIKSLLTSGFGMSGQSVSIPSTMRYENSMDSGSPTVSMRNMAPSPESGAPVNDGYASGDESEAYEVKEYNARYETRTLSKDCDTVRELKVRTDVVFENANKYYRGCAFTFKVKKNAVEEVLGILKSLNPKELVENSYTIKREVDDYTSEIQMLENKLATLDATLAEATASYSEITGLATRIGDVENLAKIIESKITILERLTNARIETNNQLERMHRAKTEALDTIEYTHFSVTMTENTYVDKEALTDSWKRVVQNTVFEINTLIQDLSIGFVAFLLIVIKFALYFGVVLVVIRFGWTFALRIWKNGGEGNIG